jgi:hypothetical protein
MALRVSTGFRNKFLKYKSFKQIFNDCCLRIYTGAQPTDADQGATGTLLVTITKASGAISLSTAQVVQIVVTAMGANGDTLTVVINGTSYVYTKASAEDTPDAVARALAALINADEDVWAVGVGGTSFTEAGIVIVSRFRGEAFTCTKSSTGSATMSDPETYVANVQGNGLAFLNDPVSGVISKNTDVWSGVAVATGTGGWFRISEYGDTPTNISTTVARIDGSVAQTGGDLNLSSTSITLGATVTLDTVAFTEPANA